MRATEGIHCATRTLASLALAVSSGLSGGLLLLSTLGLGGRRGGRRGSSSLSSRLSGGLALLLALALGIGWFGGRLLLVLALSGLALLDGSLLLRGVR